MFVVVLLRPKGGLIIVLLGNVPGLLQAIEELDWGHWSIKFGSNVGGVESWLSGFHAVGQEKGCVQH